MNTNTNSSSHYGHSPILNCPFGRYRSPVTCFCQPQFWSDGDPFINSRSAQTKHNQKKKKSANCIVYVPVSESVGFCGTCYRYLYQNWHLFLDSLLPILWQWVHDTIRLNEKSMRLLQVKIYNLFFCIYFCRPTFTEMR